MTSPGEPPEASSGPPADEPGAPEAPAEPTPGEELSRLRGGAGPKKRASRARLLPLLRAFAYALVWTLVVLAVVATLGATWLLHVAAGLPEAARLAEPPAREPGVVVLDALGQEVARRGASAGRDVTVEELPRYLVDAVLTVEDRRFYDHDGVDARGLVRAAMENLRAGKVVQGGSTLTQQLAKNLYLEGERTLGRKAREVLIAAWIERRYSKDEILALYLNRVYFGAGAYGVEAAAQRYFGKRASDVSLAEAALLAGLLKAPARLSPTSDVGRAEERATLVLEAMAEAGAITAEELDAALANPLRVRATAPRLGSGYFIDWVTKEARARTRGLAEDLVIHTTLDQSAQAAAERAVVEMLDQISDRGASQAALVALEGDGAVRAMVGGRSYASSEFNRAVDAHRQPGSAFKPFVYAAAIEAGLSPWDVRSGAPITVDGWTPENFDGARVGDVDLFHALAQSINTVAVRVSEEVGRDRVIAMARRLGVTSDLQPTAAVALGSYEVTPLELTAAYAPFANGGFAVEPYAVTRIERMDGTVLWTRPRAAARPALHPDTLALMNMMLANVVTAGTGRAAALPDRPVAGKTGTSNAFRDAWFVGYVPGFIAGVWVGADDDSPMERVTGGMLPARIWRAFMQDALVGVPVAMLDTTLAPMGDEQPFFYEQPPPVLLTPPPGAGMDEAARAELDALLGRIDGERP